MKLAYFSTPAKVLQGNPHHAIGIGIVGNSPISSH